MFFLSVGIVGLVAACAYLLGRRHRPTGGLTAGAVLRLQYPMSSDRLYEELDRYLPQPIRALPTGVAVTEPSVGEAAPVFFKPGEPQSLAEYDGQPQVVGYLQDAIQALGPNEHAIEPQLLLGMPGMGKTLLAKVVAAELQRRAARLGHLPPPFLEVFPADLPDVDALDAIMARAQEVPGTVLFIDEIHELEGSHSTKLYLVLEEGRYQFRGDAQPTRLPPLTLIAATTDYGKLHPALKRRWVRHVLEPASPEQLVTYVRRRPFPTLPDAAAAIVERTKFSGAPWEALEVYRMAVTSAKARGAPQVELPDVERVFTLQKMDRLGLRYLDRQVIQSLLGQPKYRRGVDEPEFVCYGASEQTVCTLAGLDKGEYREAVRPRLMTRGLLLVRPYYGQSLTDKAVELYGNLRKEA